MEPFRVHILGCGSALPTLKHFSSAQVVEVRGKCFMVDCGEGTQIQLRRSGVNFNKVIAVFITHLHGDHCFGLIGMISTFGLLGRTAPLHVYAHKNLRQMLQQQMDMFCFSLGYEVVFHEVDTSTRSIVYEDKSVTIESVPLNHRMPCCGYIFREKEGLAHIRREMIDAYGIPVSQIQNIKLGADWTTADGEKIANDRLTIPADEPRSYAYISDTAYMPSLADELKNVNLLYHEATYASDNVENARKYNHSTAAEAAMVARDAGVGQLMLGHYSSRYTDETVLLHEAQEIFPNTILSDENLVVDVK